MPPTSRSCEELLRPASSPTFPSNPRSRIFQESSTPETPLAAIDKDMSDWMVSTPSSSNSFESLHGFCPKIWSQTKSTFWKHWNYFTILYFEWSPPSQKYCATCRPWFWRVFWHYFWHIFLAGKRRRGKFWLNLETFGREDNRKISSELSSPPLPPPPSCWGPAVPAEIWSSQLSSGSVHWNLELAVLSGISSDILSGIVSGSIWHIFWHFFWHSIWRIFWQSFWHSFWHIFWQFSGTLSGIYSDSLSGIYHMGSCKNPEPFQMVFPHVIVLFFLLSFFQALASHLDHRIHMREEREKEKE